MTKPNQPSFTHTLSPSPSLSELSEYSIRIYNQNVGLSPSLHVCALCQQTFSSRPFTFPLTAPAALAAIRSSLPSQSRSQAFCQNCWLRIYTLSLCWTCGEIVSRSEERVSFGWCWWHWGCAPVKPPPWTGNSQGTCLMEPPLCRQCLRSLDDQQLPTPPQTPRPLPKWMANLPSNRERKSSSPKPSSPPLPSSKRSPSIQPSQSPHALSPPPSFPNSPLTQPRSIAKPLQCRSFFGDTHELKPLSLQPSYRSQSRLFFPPAPPAYASHLEEQRCVACGSGVASTDARAGPHGTVFHNWCMLCARCGELLQRESEDFGGDGAFDRSPTGGARRCRACRSGGPEQIALGLNGMNKEVRRAKRKRGRGKWRWCCGGRR